MSWAILCRAGAKEWPLKEHFTSRFVLFSKENKAKNGLNRWCSSCLDCSTRIINHSLSHCYMAFNGVWRLKSCLRNFIFSNNSVWRWRVLRPHFSPRSSISSYQDSSNWRTPHPLPRLGTSLALPLSFLLRDFKINGTAYSSTDLILLRIQAIISKHTPTSPINSSAQK